MLIQTGGYECAAVLPCSNSSLLGEWCQAFSRTVEKSSCGEISQSSDETNCFIAEINHGCRNGRESRLGWYFLLKVLQLTVRERGRNGCYVCLFQGLGCCDVQFGSKKKERDFEGLWDAVSFTIHGCKASSFRAQQHSPGDVRSSGARGPALATLLATI